MARILFAWELGGALGHLTTIRALAQSLNGLGHELHLAADAAKCSPQILDGLVATFHAIPPWRAGHDRREPVRTYAHVMHNVGYGNRNSLSAQLRAWQRLLRALKPHALVCDSSPTALLAARGLGIATVAIGTGFTIPPLTYPLPDINYWDPPPAAALHGDEDELTGTINEALDSTGSPPIARLHQVFETTLTAICSVAELDHYPSRSVDGVACSHIGAIASFRGRPPTWPAGSGPRVFAYLKNFPELPQLLQHLRRRQVSTLIYGSHLPRDIIGRYAGEQLCHVDQPVDVAEVTQTASLVITNAGHGLTLQALLAGVPVLCFPLTLDQYVLARQVHSLGAGIYCSPWGSNRIGSALDSLLDDASFTQQARNFADRHAHLVADVQASQLAARISALAS